MIGIQIENSIAKASPEEIVHRLPYNGFGSITCKSKIDVLNLMCAFKCSSFKQLGRSIIIACRLLSPEEEPTFFRRYMRRHAKIIGRDYVVRGGLYVFTSSKSDGPWISAVSRLQPTMLIMQ